VEQASKAVAALHPPGRKRDHVGRLVRCEDILSLLLSVGTPICAPPVAQMPSSAAQFKNCLMAFR